MKENNDHCPISLEVSDMDKEWGFYLTDCGSHHVTSSLSETVPSVGSSINGLLENYQLRLIVSGSGTFQSAHCPVCSYEAGSLFLLHPGEWFQFKPSNAADQEAYWVTFNGKHVSEIVNSCFFDKTTPIYRVGVNDDFLAFFQSILRYADAGELGVQQVTSGIVRNMLGLMYYRRLNMTQAEDDIREKIDRARIHIAENVTKNISPVQIAEEMGLGYSWFRKAFKRHVGISPAQYQIKLRLQRAKELLDSTNLTVSEIAYELSFDTPCQFSTFFKIRADITPLEFRKKCREAWSPQEWGPGRSSKVLAHKELLPVQLYG